MKKKFGTTADDTRVDPTLDMDRLTVKPSGFFIATALARDESGGFRGHPNKFYRQAFIFVEFVCQRRRLLLLGQGVVQ